MVAKSLSVVAVALAVACALSFPSPAVGLDNGAGRTPPLGWNTWMTCGDAGCTHDFCNEDEVRQVATAMKQNGMQALGYEYVNLDDCWADVRNSTGGLTWDSSRFPSGLPTLIDWLHQEGFKFGLYTSAGNQTCSSGGRPIKVPGSRGHYDLDAATFAEWGVDYIKLDWCGDIKTQFGDGAQAHIDFSNAVVKTGRSMFLEVVAGYFFLWGNISEYANSWRFCEDHHDKWSSSEEAIVCRLDQGNVTGAPGGWAYMDFLLTGGQGCSPFSQGPHCPGQTDDQYKTTFNVWMITQSPLIVATDVRNMTDIMNQALLNKELIAIHQSTDTPPGKQIGSWTCSELFACNVWGRKLNAEGSQWLVALTNTGSKSHKITASFSDLGWSSSQAATVYDMWTHASMPSATGSLEVEVPAGGSAIVKLTSS